MERYNYLEAVTADVKQWLLEHYETEFLINSEDYSTFYDEMMSCDSITGNVNRSYTYNRWQAEENICHNYDLLVSAADQFGYNDVPSIWLINAEIADVIIRCYYLREAIQNAMKEIKNEVQSKDLE